MSNLYSVGQMNQLGDAFEAEGFRPDDVTKLKQFGNLAGVLSVLRGLAKIKPVAEDTARVITLNPTTIAVNLGAAPELPFNGARVDQHIGDGWAVVEKRADGLYVNGRKVVLHLSKRQLGGKWLKGHELCEELADKPVLNANLLDAFYDNPHLIPEDWKKDEQGNARYIFFWGTISRDSDGYLYVRYLYFAGGTWYRYYRWLDGGWFGVGPAALLASN
ncbi:hypothetical protein A2121_01635 [Candidatus Nomurabacteria bacterium GWB1_40_6]|uniref:Uncharacterized protein n=1 Tax=Candidatus Nomurabacteria bacterium GWB1_40_6 TaxID=1801727 RepID=A0A1F6TMK7_9BACT|nr:MAG: hypothetical protein A2121_01635 [Candidatus Nomurabacteria bacterium GWB1_40_6]